MRERAQRSLGALRSRRAGFVRVCVCVAVCGVSHADMVMDEDVWAGARADQSSERPPTHETEVCERPDGETVR